VSVPVFQLASGFRKRRLMMANMLTQAIIKQFPGKF